jgi:hypothetical protein
VIGEDIYSEVGNTIDEAINKLKVELELKI